MANMTDNTLNVRTAALSPRREGLPVILKAGLIAGILDISAAFIHYYTKTGKTPLPILNFIASGVVGREDAYAADNTLVMRVLGLLLHFLIATIFAAIFYYAWPLIRKVSKSWVVNGLGYGMLVWLAMNLVVVPLSSTPAMKHTTEGVLINMLILMVCIGLPIGRVVSRARGL